MMTLEQLNKLTVEEFTQELGEVFEHSPWIARKAAEGRPILQLPTFIKE